MTDAETTEALVETVRGVIGMWRYKREGDWDERVAAGDEALDALAARLSEAETQRDNARFELQGLEHVRKKDNQYLIDRAEAAERRVATLEAALAAYRSALRSGEPESEQLRAMGDSALAAQGSGEDTET